MARSDSPNASNPSVHHTCPPGTITFVNSTLHPLSGQSLRGTASTFLSPVTLYLRMYLTFPTLTQASSFAVKMVDSWGPEASPWNAHLLQRSSRPVTPGTKV